MPIEFENSRSLEPPKSPRVGIVVIGRNEGQRLYACLSSVKDFSNSVVYVDSGSTDNSLEIARLHKVYIEELDMSIPFSAARARNVGFYRLHQFFPSIEYIQFIDGDCELNSDWIAAGMEVLDARLDIAAVSGRLREKHPKYSVYNRLCDMEWDVPDGERQSCGGITMMRVAAFHQVAGFNPNLVCGEEPELCARLRTSGWKIFRIPKEMATHDANMTRFRQWWYRALRAGYGSAQAADMTRNSSERRGFNESLSAWFWGFSIPVVVALSTAVSPLWGSLLLLAYPFQVARIAIGDTRGYPDNLLRATFLVLGKFPEVLGQAKFTYEKVYQLQSKLIEHK